MGIGLEATGEFRRRDHFSSYLEKEENDAVDEEEREIIIGAIVMSSSLNLDFSSQKSPYHSFTVSAALSTGILSCRFNLNYRKNQRGKSTANEFHLCNFFSQY